MVVEGVVVGAVWALWGEAWVNFEYQSLYLSEVGGVVARQKVSETNSKNRWI